MVSNFFFLGRSLRNLNEIKFDKKRIWIIELLTHPKKKKNSNTWSFTIYFYEFDISKLLYDNSLLVVIIYCQRG